MHLNGIEAEIVLEKFCVLVIDCLCDVEGVDLASAQMECLAHFLNPWLAIFRAPTSNYIEASLAFSVALWDILLAPVV